jgi:energy-coupling factor transport system permease protein
MAQVLLEGLKFRYQRSVIHELDPRVKLLLTALLFVFSLIGYNFYQEAVTFCLIAVPAILARVLRRMMRLMVFAVPFSLFIILLNMWGGGTLLHSIVIAVRFIEIVSSTSLFFVTTSPDELEYVLRWFRFPRDFVFAFATSIRFVPVMMIDLNQIIDAQKSRGLEIEKGGPIKRIRNLVPVLVPLIVTALVRSSELAEAMEARGYGAVKKPTSLFNLKLQSNDLMALSIILPGSVALILLYLYML